MDAVAKDDSTSIYGNCVALDESPLVEDLLYVGTDDGLVQVTEDGGRDVAEDRGVPGRAGDDLRELPHGVADTRRTRSTPRSTTTRTATSSPTC